MLIGILLNFSVSTWAATDLSSIRWVIMSDSGYNYRAQDYEEMKDIGVDAVLDTVDWVTIEISPGVFDFSFVYQSFQRCQEAGIVWIPQLATHYKPSWMGTEYDFFDKDGNNYGDCMPPNYFHPNTQYYVTRFIQAFCDYFANEADSIPLVFISSGQYGESYYPNSNNFAAFDSYTIAALRSYTGNDSTMPPSSTTAGDEVGIAVDDFLYWWYDKKYDYIAYNCQAVHQKMPNTQMGLKIAHNVDLGQITEEQVEAALPYNLGVISFGGPTSQISGVKKVGEVAASYNKIAWVESFIRDYSSRSNSIELTRSRMLLNNISGIMYATVLDLISADWPPPAYQKKSEWYTFAELISGYDSYAESLSTWYFAEGYTGSGYDTWIILQNPNLKSVNATVTFTTDNDTTEIYNYNISATNRTAIGVDGLLPNTSMATKIEADGPIVAERAMYWTAGGVAMAGGHGSSAASTPATTAYFAEGSTQEGFKTFIVFSNSNFEPAYLDFTFYREDNPNVNKSYTVPAQSRFTLDLSTDVPNENSIATMVESSLPVVGERAMYWEVAGVPYGGGSCSNAITTPETTWYLAEGSTQIGFETWVLVQNPNDSSIGVQCTFMKQGGDNEVLDITLPPNSRRTLDLRSIVPNTDSVATKVIATLPVIVERAMYWTSGGFSRAGGHACAGQSETGTMLLFAEGSTGDSFDEWIVIQNPSSSEAVLKITFMGPEVTDYFVDANVSAGSRYTIHVDDLYALDSVDVSTKIESLNGVGIIAERAMYWSADDQDKIDGHVCSALNAS